MATLDLVRTSKRLSFLLRHSPDYIDLNGGWAWTEEIVAVLRETTPSFTERDLHTIVSTDPKGRYSYDRTGRKIRANQGHSVPGVVVEMEEPEPPEVLYHGTATRFLPSILEEGLNPMGRLFVHLSTTKATAWETGSRHGKPVILAAAAREMARDGLPLKRSVNGVWQAKAVPPQYLTVETAPFPEKTTTK